MKSWILFFFPTTDEYKQQQLSLFFAEGGIVLLLSLIGMIVFDNYFAISVVNALLIPIVIFLSYLTIRYAASGIEFGNVATDKTYKRELKVIFVQIGVFAVFMLGYLLIFRPTKWIEGIILVIGLVFVWFLVNFMSLNRSYKKNKDLL